MSDVGEGSGILFAEPGARWRSVSYGPGLCLIILFIELVTATAVHWFALIFCAALIAGFVVLQVIAGRRHVSVELTDSILREGTETLPLSAVAAVLPERDEDSWDDEDWESARALGELSGVPRRRGGIGLRLVDGSFVQAWAKDHRGLRAALTEALDRQCGTPGSDATDGIADSVDEVDSVEDPGGADDRHSENGADR
ncbi:hypothetical protein ACLMAL_09790 [Nocardia sp. CWNU-33]|uniref:hypothetical protein n=1 Tax=Nocardia sp. CWNU-33 TaxID=3392117 RepID=UPI00398E7EED